MKNETTEKTPEGILILDKPAGITSHDCVAKIRRLFHTKKVGHTGTLDPMATGVLPILLGRAAKAAEYLTAENKGYTAVLRLGITTDTEDTTGTVLSTSDTLPDEATVLSAVSAFQGEILQTPPMYSALKVNGKKLCDLARDGITVERNARPVHIHSILAEKLDDTSYRLDVSCSKGTYIRTLCADIGQALGCGGVMASLRRTQSGSYALSDAVTLEALEAMSDAERLSLLAPTESLFSDCPALCLPPFYEKLAENGQEIYLHKLKNAPAYPVGTRLRICGGDGFFALGEVREFPCEDGELRPAVKPIKKFVL